MMRLQTLNKYLLTTFVSLFCLSDLTWAECTSSEFVTDYCYLGLAPTLDERAIAVKPKQYGYEASTIAEVKRKETGQLLVVCSNGQQPSIEFNRIVKDERLLISEERYNVVDAIDDLKEEYSRMRTRLNSYLCNE